MIAMRCVVCAFIVDFVVAGPSIRKTFPFIVAHVCHIHITHSALLRIFDCIELARNSLLFKCNWDEIWNIQMNFYILSFSQLPAQHTYICKLFRSLLAILFSGWSLACKCFHVMCCCYFNVCCCCCFYFYSFLFSSSTVFSVLIMDWYQDDRKMLNFNFSVAL